MARLILIEGLCIELKSHSANVVWHSKFTSHRENVIWQSEELKDVEMVENRADELF